MSSASVGAPAARPATSAALPATGVSGPAGSPGQSPGGTSRPGRSSPALTASSARPAAGQRPGDPVEDVVFAGQHRAETEPLHEPVEDERATADHVDAPGAHHPHGGALGPGLG